MGNVSASGLFLLSAAPLAPGTRVKVNLRSHEAAHELIAEAEVVWARDPLAADDAAQAERGASGLALRFLELSGEGQGVLNALLAQGRRPA